MTPHVGTLPDGTKGFDTNTTVGPVSARELKAVGYDFAIRYIRRAPVNTYDISVGEIATILQAGLGLMLVQHVASENVWRPTAELGSTYGMTAAQECRKVGLLPGVTVWLDLEGLHPESLQQPETTIQYCNNWYKEVYLAGYRPGLYVGWHAGLTADQLYRRLKFSSYWSGYNLNGDQYPAVRGVQLQQKVAKNIDLIPGFTTQNLDVDYIGRDKLGDTPSLLLP